MLLNWLEQKLEPEQFERLEKLRTNLVEIVYVNVVFAFFAIILGSAASILDLDIRRHFPRDWSVL